MFTDWTMTDPRYFYGRGAIWGFVMCLVITQIVIPKIKEWIRNR